MKELNEKEIQRLIEEQLKDDGNIELPGNEKDAALYRLLFNAMEPNNHSAEPVWLQNDDLAEAVVKQININEQKKESVQYILIIASVLLIGILFTYLSINCISPVFLKSAFNFIEIYKWLILFIILCFVAIETADKKLVKTKFVISH